MMENLDNNQIERYLRGELGKAEFNSFQDKMEKDHDFAHRVAIYQAIFEAAGTCEIEKINNELKKDFEEDSSLIEYEENRSQVSKKTQISNLLDEIKEELKEEGFFDASQENSNYKTPNSRLYRIIIGFSLAASVILLLLFNHLNNQPKSLDYFVEVPIDKLTPRINAFALQGLVLLHQGMEAYNRKDFEEASKQLKTYVLETNPPKPNFKDEAVFYLAISLVKIGTIDKGQHYLEKLIEADAFVLRSDAKWYLAQIYLAQNNKIEANRLLKTLFDDKDYGKKARKLVEGN